MANVGGIDRGLRLVVGLALMLVIFLPMTAGWFTTWGGWRWLLPVWGAVMIGTAVFRFCPAYVLLGIRTCPLQR